MLRRTGRRDVAVVIAVFAVALGACSNATDDPSDDARGRAGNSVAIAGFLFRPGTLRVPVATTVVWTNSDDIAHTVTAGTPEAPTNAFPPSGDRVKGESYMRTFDTPGTYTYFCSNHNGMRGEIDVT